VADLLANVDETGWREGGKRGWQGIAVTVYPVHMSRGRKAFAELIRCHPGVLTTDRYPVYDHLPADRRQVCWAHLRPDFQAMIDRTNAGREAGEGLLVHADILLRQWTQVRLGTLTRRGFGTRYLHWIRTEVRPLLAIGAACRCGKTARLCQELLTVERALRHAVCWRMMSFGTDWAGGSRFVERVPTVATSCRQQGRDMLAFLTDAIQATRTGTQPPSLIPMHASTP
jgi:transposase